ncbi:MAG: DUF1275 domain-containing protein [Bdellovibrionaceae bacterium]|nr:DUF1275 domain-containing protein [Pseudobdellovibrionaceae bacterium]
MFTHILNETSYSPKKFLIWTSFAFQAGCVNVGGFLACHRFVTHTTGFATFFGSEMAKGSVSMALGYLSVPLFFLAGAMFSAFFTDRRSLHNHKPNFLIVFAVMWVCFLTVIILSEFQFFGVFGEEISLSKDYFLISLLSLSSGLQNAMITSVSKTVVRTTHLTGLTTDLGIGLIRIFSSPTEYQRHQEIQAIRMRLGIIIGFILGSWLGASVFYKYDYRGFFIPFLITSLFLFLSIKNRLTKV